MYLQSVCLPSYVDSCTSEENIASQTVGDMANAFNETIAYLNKVEVNARSTCADPTGGCIFVEVKDHMACKQTGQVLATASEISATMASIEQAANAAASSPVDNEASIDVYTTLVERISNNSVPSATSIAFSKIESNVDNAMDGSFSDSVVLAANATLDSLVDSAASMRLVLTKGLDAFSSSVQGKLLSSDASLLNVYQEKMSATLEAYVALMNEAIGESSTDKEIALIDFR